MFKKIGIAILTLFAIVIFFGTLSQALFHSSASDLTVPQAHADATVTTDHPVTLYIPALNIDAKVQQVGLTISGKMAVPTNYTDVGWYKYGTLPGQTGSAVIAGHVDDGLALPGVFINLDQLKPGDDIYVAMSDKHTLHYVVTNSIAYSKDADTSTIFNDKSGKLLKLITCTGTWLPTQSTHDQRLVVTAVEK
ncbi:MAG TPA: class F sortase [Candidatus Paceibacterota bacterium]|jgi:LPXTG-site transpeptidase (sortase) family protein|nr:class F sortase [Candidatus Paceibacterota bacterium]